MNFVSEVLTAIDEAENVTLESMVEVYDNMLNEYDKLISSQTCYVEGFVMEASATKESIMDQATGAGKNESVITKIIAFLPRLIIATIKRIASIFTKDKEKEIKSFPDKLETTINNSSEEELKQKDEKLNKETDGVVRVHPKRKLFIVRGFRHIKNAVMLLTTVPGLFKLIRESMQKKTFTWSRLASDMKNFYANKGEITKLLNEGKSAEEISSQLKNYAADEVSCLDMKDVLKIFTSSGFAISALADEAELTFNKIAVKKDKAGLDPTEAMKAEEVARSVKNISGTIAFLTKIFKGIFGFVTGFRDAKKVIGTKEAVNANAAVVNNDAFQRFKNSAEGSAYSGYETYADVEKALKSKGIKGALTKGKSKEWNKFVDDFSKWKAANDDEHIHLPSQSNIDKAENEADSRQDRQLDTIIKNEHRSKDFELVTDKNEPNDWDKGGEYYDHDLNRITVKITKEGGTDPEYKPNTFYRKKV